MLSVFKSRLPCAAGGLAVLMAACLAFSSGEAFAQQKHKYSFKAPPGTTKFTQTHLMEVGDVPAHQLHQRRRADRRDREIQRHPRHPEG